MKIGFQRHSMDKLQQTGQNLGRMFNSISVCVHAMQLHFFETKQPKKLGPNNF